MSDSTANGHRLWLVGGEAVLPERVLPSATILIEHGVIAEILDGAAAPAADPVVDCRGCWVVPGFVDVHVHGVSGRDVLDGGDAVRRIARELPRFGVTAFCPTSIACGPEQLAGLLSAVRDARSDGPAAGARVLPAHLESNFINPDYKGAQPGDCLRSPSPAVATDGPFTGRDIVEVMAANRSEVGIVTLAPEVDGVLDLIPVLVQHGIRVSVGHSGASYEQAIAAIEAGARHATHLFNRMTPLGHRVPGLAAAVLDRADVDAELVCDGVHVHPAMMRVAIAAKGTGAVMAITDGTAGSGLAPGSRTHLGHRAITVREAAYLDDGTLAGSVLTMNQAFARLIGLAEQSPVSAAALCATTPARALGLPAAGLAPGSPADVAILDRRFEVRATFRGGVRIWPAFQGAGGGTPSPAPPSIEA
jgi:N-acetylglucosamine-6-phosphate deacetylase